MHRRDAVIIPGSAQAFGVAYVTGLDDLCIFVSRKCRGCVYFRGCQGL